MILNIDGRPVDIQFNFDGNEDLLKRLRVAMFEKTMFYLSNGKEYALFHPKFLFGAYTQDQSKTTYKGPNEFAYAISTAIIAGYKQFGDEAAMEKLPKKKVAFIFDKPAEEPKPEGGRIILLN